ncbi:unnamed protein product [Rotaria magnacalcarata]|uniref:Uncharacterized protein n=2 Tax=Rotaria magnacalcarata TaxID=392030 RepID=A0A816RE63_9BILA|nr:unnamed protein product [Rotaria magnacalcarata]CAF1323407.1 unnamed protein product [Rotaria magnacalcarata]CAF2072752.1 unnamed protein product [Rotaria magnacalcarata]CAF3860451.1 unnamed protein product [Rotaria magnacalcarata]CAF3888007.1 unnamed protein product [Rotaria magnacalcarata]
MGVGGSVINKNTNELWTLITNHISNVNSLVRAQRLIQDGVEIKKPNNNGQYFLQALSDQERRNRLAGMINEADGCQQLISMLKTQASTLFVTALDNEDMGEMRVLVEYFGADCYQGNSSFGPLGLIGHAVQKSDLKLETIKFLLEKDLRNISAITQCNQEGQTVFTLAKCQKTIIDYLKKIFNAEMNKLPFQPFADSTLAVQWIQQGANPEWTNEKGNTVLCNAILAGKLELVRSLLAAQCNIKHKNLLKETPLSIAKTIEPKNPQIIALLENEGVNRRLRSLIIERKEALTQVEVQDLLKQGADIKSLGSNNDSPLHLLISNNSKPEMITTFVNVFSADIEIMDWNGYRPIETCILHGNPEQLKAFFKLAKVRNEHFFNSKLNKSLLAFAKEKQNSMVKPIQTELNLRVWKCILTATRQEKKNTSIMNEAKQLCNLGAQINHLHMPIDDDAYKQWSVLHLACKIGNLSLVQFLIENLNANKEGAAPLSIAAEYDQLDIVQYLRTTGSKVNVISNKDTQDTPLHLAAKNNHLVVVRYLVLWGANHTVKNISGQTPLDLARVKKSKMTKEDKVQNKQLIKFLEQLECPELETEERRRQSSSTTIDPDIDVCQIPLIILVDKIKPHDVNDEDPKGRISLGVFAGTPNGNLRKAAEQGLFDLAKASIAEGADIRHRESNTNLSCYQIVLSSAQKHMSQARATLGHHEEQVQHTAIAQRCNQIASLLQNIAQTKLIEAIQENRSDRVVSYHNVGAQLTPNLLLLACQSADNLEIVDYLINCSPENFSAMFTYPENQESPFAIATKAKHLRVASYLNWRLCDELTKAINANDLNKVRCLTNAGGSVDNKNQQHLLTAVKHNNLDMVIFLCDMGARIPDECLQQSDTLTQITSLLNQRQLDRKLRLAAAQGNYNTVVDCQRQGADINAKNCHGSTAVSMVIQHGNYFRIVHSLVSHGASILHSNPKLSTLLQLSKNQNFKQISKYLFNQLNAQFLTAIINNDLQIAQQLASMGADTNHADEYQRTPLHYAVQYHDVDFVKWLCESGAHWKVADVNGQYPITEATEKGDLPVVKYFVENRPATKELKNKAGQNALAIAKSCRYNRIVQLLDPGNPDYPVKDDEEDEKLAQPKYNLEQLIRAVENGQVSIVKEFIDQRYPKMAMKIDHCGQMIEAAKRKDQQEVLVHLRAHYASITAEINPANVLTVTEQQKLVLDGFLGYLSDLIAGSDVKLNPADPKAYQQLYKNLHLNSTERIAQLNSVHDDNDIKQIHEKDMNDIKNKLDSLQTKLQQMEENRIDVTKAIENSEEKLQQAKTAIEKRDFSKEIQDMRSHMTVLASEVILCKAAREATVKKKEILEAIQNDLNLIHFYNTIETQLQSLFTAVSAAQSGMIKAELGSKTGLAETIINWIPDSIIPLPEPVMFLLKQTATSIVSVIDKTKQNKEYRNISTLGNIQYLHNAATNCAALLTLYYKEQIELIDVSRKVVGNNVLASFFTWTKNKLDGKPNENAIVLVAEYAVAWMIDELKEGEREVEKNVKVKNFVPNEPLGDQLWLCVVRQDPLAKNTAKKLGIEMGKHKVPLKNGKSTQLQRLFGCPKVVVGGYIYQPVLSDDINKNDTFSYGYVYLDPFTDKITAQLIIAQRQLIKIDNGSVKVIPDILDNVDLFREGREHISSTVSTTNDKQTAISLAYSMREQNLVVDPEQMKHAIQKARSDIVDEVNLDVNTLRDNFNAKATHFQISIDAAYEKIGKDFEKCQENLLEAQRVEYQALTRKLFDQIKQSQQQIESVIKKQTQEMENFLKEKSEQQGTIVLKSEQQSTTAVNASNKAKESSRASEQSAKQSAVYSQQLVESTEQRKQEMQKVIDENLTRLEATITEQKLIYERSLEKRENNFRTDMERMKQHVDILALKASESAKAADKAASDAKKAQKNADQQINVLKEERKRILKEAKGIKEASEKAADHAKNVDDRSKKLQEKIDKMTKKI